MYYKNNIKAYFNDEFEVELKELSKSVNLENSEIRTFCDYGDTRPYIDNVINVIVDNYSNKKSK